MDSYSKNGDTMIFDKLCLCVMDSFNKSGDIA